MASSPDPLDQPASLRTLRQWQREGKMDAVTLHQAARLIHPAVSWQVWLRLELLVAGMALVLSGILFFFAYNWAGLGRFEKLGLIEAALLACILGACWKGVRTLAGQLLTLTATVMTGAFLAVFGQIYQTGADAYELFTGWAALTLVWVLIARLEALWFLWLVILQTGIILFWMQVAGPVWNWTPYSLSVLLAAINTVALAVREKLQPSGSHLWLRRVLLLAVLVTLSLPALRVIFEDFDGQPWRAGHVLAWLMAVAAGYAFFRFRQPDFACVALVSADVAVMVVCTLGRFILAQGEGTGALGLFLIIALITVGATTGLTMWLTRQHNAMKHLPL